MPSDRIERALLTGDQRGLLEDYFGAAQYTALRDLARDAATRSTRGGQRVLILPGIMGSTLGKKGFPLDNTLWFDPLEIALGRLTHLKLNGGSSQFQALGVILFAYLKLKLVLKIAGFDADFFPFDWRQSIDTLGGRLADAIRKEPATQVSLVAHSMGGLVARAAFPQIPDKVARLIMLGTPNHGSFAPAQVIRGTYDTVLKIDELDRFHNVEQLCEVFNTFPGIYQMLPAPEKFTEINLYNAATWPKKGPQPRPNLLAGVKAVIDKLAPADPKFLLIAGANQNTVTGLRVNDQGEFEYEISQEGDGTVPLAFARLTGLSDHQVYYVEEGHGSLPNNGRVETAVKELLATGVTSALPHEKPPIQRATRLVSEPELFELARRAPGTGQLGTRDHRHLLDAVAAPASREDVAMGAAAGAGAPADTGSPQALTPQFKNLVIGRRRQQRLELTLARGSITEVDSRAYVLGVFRNVAPSGAANAIDQRLDGAITEFTARRMFSGNVGEIFSIPAGRKTLRADMVLFAGLGAFDRFNADVQQLVAENVIRVLIRSNVEEFATVLIGAGSGQSASAVLQNLLIGFFRGLRDADRKNRFRGITVCETDSARFAEMKAELFRLTSTQLFEDVELTLEEIELPEPVSPAPARVLRPGQEPAYVIVRQEGRTKGTLHYRTSILGSGMKAAVVTRLCDVDEAKLAAELTRLDRAVQGRATTEDLRMIGSRLAELLLPAEVCDVLQTLRERHLVIVHDAPASRIPWETLTINGWTPSVAAGLSRRYLADNLPIATWLEQRRLEPALNLLLIVNPLGDLRGAESEGDRVLNLAGATGFINVTEFRGDRATKAALLSALRSGAFDVVHYAGHAFFDPDAPAQSGLICAGREVLSGADLIGFSNLPFLVFANACEAGRVRGEKTPPPKAASKSIHESFGIAEALMRGGVSNYMSTYWPVADDAAETFADTFYKSVLAGHTVGMALLDGRKHVAQTGSRDWADYVLYGSYDFVLKQH